MKLRDYCKWEMEISCFQWSWDSNTPVSQTRWDPLPHWKNRPRICVRWEKCPEIYPHWKTTLNSHPHWAGKALKFWESSLDFWALNNKIQNHHQFKKEFSIPIGIWLLHSIPTGLKVLTGSLRQGGINKLTKLAILKTINWRNYHVIRTSQRSPYSESTFFSK